MKTMIWIIVIAAVLAIIVYGSILIERSMEYQDPDRCVRLKPRVVTGGRIWHSSGFLGGGYTSYRLWYKGKTGVTDEDCETSSIVTEAEYDRRMFGDD